MLPLTQYLTILMNLKVNRKQSINCANQRLQDNEDWMISEFRLTGRAARSIPRPLGRGGCAQFDFQIKNKPVKAGRLIWLKRFLFLVIILIPLISAINSAGGIEAIDPFYGTENGISIARAGSYIIFFVQISFFTIFALLGGKRGFCHYFCPIAVIMILGRKMRNIFAWPALHLSAEKDRCTDCRRCSKNCPMSLDVNNMVRQQSMENSECILCGCCVDHCPESAIRYAWFG